MIVYQKDFIATRPATIADKITLPVPGSRYACASDVNPMYNKNIIESLLIIKNNIFKHTFL